MTPMPFAPTVPELAAANREARRRATFAVSNTLLVASIANGDRHKTIARRHGVSASAVTTRLNRIAHARGLSTTPQLVAAFVREGRIRWAGTRWVPADTADHP